LREQRQTLKPLGSHLKIQILIIVSDIITLNEEMETIYGNPIKRQCQEAEEELLIIIFWEMIIIIVTAVETSNLTQKKHC
jgi:hypothetical protein